MDANLSGGAQTHGGRQFFQSSGGRWAGERLLAAMAAGRKIGPGELRTLDTLPRDSWKAFDETAVREGMIRAPIVADLIEAKLTTPIANAMGKTMFEYDKVTDMEAAVVSLDGLARSDNDRVTFEPGNVPLPITHKDFNIGLRTLAASRESGEPLDTLQAAVSGGKVGEQIANMVINGGPTFGAATIYGLRTAPARNTGGFGTNGNWVQAAKTGENIYTDVSTMAAALRADRFYGPYWLRLPSAYAEVIGNDYKANSDRTIRERLLQIEGVEKISTDDQMPANNVVLFQATRDVVALANGEGVQTIQWDIYGGMAVAFKVFAIQVPIVRSTEAGRSGIYHMS
jgi:uncharacterized linocin/CFP29 family protein